ncbi:hypothetical protein PTTG_06035 [Puccinia triticina 1-1 BBBD Race 1]|uniref:DUF6818 domain-containing protein n=1 Tax=Puccinia triticina (isolate 1-1 / race 1 (BBBD)) TaxID=630390 RepID=A0A180G8U9_PUCT1|nr:hypothetical protein PTTG_06035 [Puccinia triticina 1-1 BBBD Race 1]
MASNPQPQSTQTDQNSQNPSPNTVTQTQPCLLGYNSAECLLLVKAVKKANNLKQNFKGLAQTVKPTGNSTCPEHVREAKKVNDLINEKANECVLGSLSSGDKRNGVGAEVALSKDDDVDVNDNPSGGKVDPTPQESILLSGWSQTQTPNPKPNSISPPPKFIAPKPSRSLDPFTVNPGPTISNVKCESTI